jgi:probable DNA metabolism protein
MEENSLFSEPLPVTNVAARPKNGVDHEYRFYHEFDRLRGLLRFAPETGEDGESRYTARCAPVYFVLPLLAEHFSKRFGKTPWAIIDERRGLTVKGGGTEGQGAAPSAGAEPGATAGKKGQGADLGAAAGKKGQPAWEELWREYHRTISIEGRDNPKLQRQFIPERYRKYLTEFDK